MIVIEFTAVQLERVESILFSPLVPIHGNAIGHLDDPTSSGSIHGEHFLREAPCAIRVVLDDTWEGGRLVHLGSNAWDIEHPEGMGVVTRAGLVILELLWLVCVAV